ncbi:helix-turn-helix transcriptional regulator [Alkalihalophilus marmarensis]|uniref:HTH araC/xylS-type domain-containing protein n=1 Tax=Alkalihalophilus marmarensis DSM 21297 TaxID=1188261 RepID=U6SPK0_9BACI|nr:helix-turn-helix transcriptional regulator [Alkalihalophilus marmarensis]ERN52571.1 hypothetical protein A33I_00540 [Alkalihalophilus marmarensis DSM 21297]MCM3490970.1 helix-turn-helix transcriptional regulator [Alkalihalophilus marmarensis]
MTISNACILQLKSISFQTLECEKLLDVGIEDNEMLLLYIETGKVQRVQAEQPGKEGIYQNGNILWVDKTDRIYGLNQVTTLFFAVVWIDRKRLIEPPVLYKASQTKVDPLWKQLFTVAKDSFNQYCKQQTLFWSLLDLITQEHTSYPGKMEIIIEEITNHIVEPHMEPLTVSELAKKANMTPASFSRAFKRHTGFSPKEFINSCRIKKAKELMREKKDITLKEVADLAGFQDEFYFSKLFKKKEGVAPSIFKKGLP